jgi:hypothetical protein
VVGGGVVGVEGGRCRESMASVCQMRSHSQYERSMIRIPNPIQIHTTNPIGSRPFRYTAIRASSCAETAPTSEKRL